ncbi:hypothetical protein CN193_19800 [Sinorhizobium meliloti]|nr:hypothetical protein CN193_19800 [Sinorhizobium meliloti]
MCVSQHVQKRQDYPAHGSAVGFLQPVARPQVADAGSSLSRQFDVWSGTSWRHGATARYLEQAETLKSTRNRCKSFDLDLIV